MFPILAMMSKALMNIFARSLCGHHVFVSLGSVPRSGIAGQKRLLLSYC